MLSAAIQSGPWSIQNLTTPVKSDIDSAAAVTTKPQSRSFVLLRRWRVSHWHLAALLLVSAFLINNRELLSGARVQIWDAYAFYTPAFSLVADHARTGRLLFW